MCKNNTSCQSCKNAKPIKGIAGSGGRGIKDAGIDEILRNANISGLTAVGFGVLFGEYIGSKAKKGKTGSIQFKMFLVGMFNFAAGIYLNAQTKSEFMDGLTTGLSASGITLIFRNSGIPAFAGLEGFKVGKIGKVKVLKPYAILPKAV